MTTTDEKIDELARQVEAMTVALERLYALLSERPAGGGVGRKSKAAQALPTFTAAAYQSTASSILSW